MKMRSGPMPMGGPMQGGFKMGRSVSMSFSMGNSKATWDKSSAQ
jgi:hypothetical protein